MAFGQLTAAANSDAAAQIFPCDRNKFKESLAERTGTAEGSSTSEAGPKRSHWEQRGVAMVQIIARPDRADLGNLQQELLAEGYEVGRAASIREASDALACVTFFPDVVLLDGLLAGPADRNLQNLKMFFNRSKTMVLGCCDPAGKAVGISCLLAFRQGVSDFMWYPSVGGLEELTARIERLLHERHRAEVEATRQRAATEKEEMMCRMLRLKELQRLDVESQKANNKGDAEHHVGEMGLPVTPDKMLSSALASMKEEGDEYDELDEDEAFKA